jgi:hypothetical protein
MGMITRLAGQKAQSSRTGARLRGTALLVSVVAIGATAVGALAATGPARAAASSGTATPDEWRAAYVTHGGPSKGFWGITAPARNDAWAVGESDEGAVQSTAPVFAHWNGKTWSSATVKAAAGLYFGFRAGAYSTSPGNVWFFGSDLTKATPQSRGSEALVYNGKGWHVQALPADFAVPLAVLGPRDVWGETYKSDLFETGDSTVLTHWNGSTWSHVTIKGVLPAVSSAGGHAWLMTIDTVIGFHRGSWKPAGAPLLYRTSGAVMKKIPAPRPVAVTGYWSGIAAAPDGRLWIANDLISSGRQKSPEIYSWAGDKWLSSAYPANAVAEVAGTLTYDGKNGFWDGMAGHWTGRKWGPDVESKQLVPFAPTAGVVGPIPGTSSFWAAGVIPRTGKTVPVNTDNAAIAVYGPLP